MGTARRQELLYRGEIEVGGVGIIADLRSNGQVWGLFDGATLSEHFIEPEVTFDSGFMVIVGHPVTEAAGVTREWRVPQPERNKLVLTKQVVKRGSQPTIEAATVTWTQYRVRVHSPTKGVDLSLPGAKISTINGKRVILDGESVYTLSNAGCGCGKG